MIKIMGRFSKWILIVLMAKVTANAGNYTGQTLSPRQQSLISITAFTAKGELSKLKTALNTGLDAGLTVNEIKEAMIHLYAYCGFPRSIRGLQTLMAVLDERKARGIHDEPGAEVTPVRDDRSRYVRGREILEKLSGIQESGPKTGYAAFAPQIEKFLKEHLFADLFERDILSYIDRELVTISVLSSLGGLEPMLTGHLNICLNIGLTPDQLRQFVAVIESGVGKKEAKAGRSVLNEVLKNRK